MGESLYGKFAFYIDKAGFIILIPAFFVSMTFGWLMPDIIVNILVLGLIITIVGIVLGIVGIIKDDLKEKAIRALIAGICFLIVGILIIVVFHIFANAING